MLTRYADWQTRLHEFLIAHLTAEFQYGTLDCCLFACDAVLAMTGTDLAQGFRGAYKSASQARSLIEKQTGTKRLRALLDQVFRDYGLPSIPLSCAHRGDLIALRRGGGESLGFVGLSGTEVVAMAKRGYLRFPMDRACAAWRV